MTNSIPWPNMFDVARNRVGVISDNASVVNRSKLLILTEPTELYNEPQFGVGLKRHLFKYKTENEVKLIQDRVVAQLRMHEPCCNPDNTQFADGLLFTEGSQPYSSVQDANRLKMTVAIQTTFGDTAEVTIDGDFTE